MTADIKLSGLTRKLVIDGLISEEEAKKAQASAIKEKVSVVKYLSDKKLVSANKIAVAGSHEFGLPVMDLAGLDLEQLPKELVDLKLIKKHHALPLYKRGNRLYIGISEPTNLAAVDEIKFHTGINTEAVLVEVDKLDIIIEKILEGDDEPMADMLGDEDMDDLDFEDAEADNKPKQDDSAVDDTPIVRFVNKVLLDAIKKGASDIHFEPYEKRYRVRLRIDGVLREVASPPVVMGNRLSARIKVMSRMDTAERRVPQDGRIKMRISKNKAIDFRVNTCPTLFGEKLYCVSWTLQVPNWV